MVACSSSCRNEAEILQSVTLLFEYKADVNAFDRFVCLLKSNLIGVHRQKELRKTEIRNVRNLENVVVSNAKIYCGIQIFYHI